MSADTSFPVRVAVLVPCLNEERTIARVVRDFVRALPGSRVYVYDNNSTDNTVAQAVEAGAVVCSERAQGKGNVIRRMFTDIDADVYLMVDGDDTYDAGAAPGMLEYMLTHKLDMINGRRVHVHKEAFPPGHQFGNRMLTGLVRLLFRSDFDDMLTGFKMFSRRFVKSFPALTRGFDIETELTVHALEMRMAVAEMPVDYRERPLGSQSKLRTFRDGWRILRTIGSFLKAERPLLLFLALSALFTLVGAILSVPLLLTYWETGLVPRLPTAIGIVGLILMAALSLTAGMILETVTLGRQEMKRLHYLSLPPIKDWPSDMQRTAHEEADAAEALPR